LSSYSSWDQGKHSEDYIINPENISPILALDEIALTNGELYTVLSNKAARGKKKSLVAMVKGTQAEEVIKVLYKIPSHKRNKVKEISLDMAGSMNMIAKMCFVKAERITDRFHVQKLAFEAVQEIRIKHRWEEIENENNQYQLAKAQKTTFQPQVFSNGDSPKQLLARGRYLLFKAPYKWTETQKQRAEILFENYPDIKKAYFLSNSLASIYNQELSKGVALTKMAHWFNEAEKSEFKSFSTIKRTFELHYQTILNYFNNRSTNAYAESFNSKIKDFRRNFRGVTDTKFFLFRLNNIFG
jgi:transposase